MSSDDTRSKEKARLEAHARELAASATAKAIGKAVSPGIVASAAVGDGDHHHGNTSGGAKPTDNGTKKGDHGPGGDKIPPSDNDRGGGGDEEGKIPPTNPSPWTAKKIRGMLLTFGSVFATICTVWFIMWRTSPDGIRSGISQDEVSKEAEKTQQLKYIAKIATATGTVPSSYMSPAVSSDCRQLKPGEVIHPKKNECFYGQSFDAYLEVAPQAISGKVYQIELLRTYVDGNGQTRHLVFYEGSEYRVEDGGRTWLEDFIADNRRKNLNTPFRFIGGVQLHF